MGESTEEQLRLGFDARVRLEFRGGAMWPLSRQEPLMLANWG